MRGNGTKREQSRNWERRDKRQTTRQIKKEGEDSNNNGTSKKNNETAQSEKERDNMRKNEAI